MSLKPLFIVSCLSLLACASTPPAKTTVDKSSPDKSAPQNVKPAPIPSEPEPLSKAPVAVSVEEIPRLDPGAELAPIMKAFEGKLYFDGLAQLEEHEVAARRGQGSLDFQLQVYAMTGQAHAMMGEGDLAMRAYRKVLSKWQHPKSLATKLQKAHPEDGEARTARALDAFGEALFFMAEQKRAKLEVIDFPYNEVGDKPAEVKRFLDGPVKRWLRQRTVVTQAAAREYDRIDTITPGTPERWLSAAHARKGLMVAQTLELVRSFTAPVVWESEGASEHLGADKKPMSWPEIHAAFARDLEAITQPLVEEAAKSYEACADTAKAAGIDNALVKSCRQWLAANR